MGFDAPSRAHKFSQHNAVTFSVFSTANND
jgi:hypothetical protein